MRIIAGAKRGMKLFSPPPLLRFAKQSGGGSRPITDRVKESLFNVLYKYDLPADKVVADLFCGVGSLGLEALSRGAEFVTFVEKDLKIITILKKNIEKAGFAGEPAYPKARPSGRSKVIRADAFRIGAPVDEQKYDLIFVDPPYLTTRETNEGSPLGKLLVLLSEQSAVDSPRCDGVAAGGIVVVRTERRTELLERYGCFQIIERRQWGTMAVTILQRPAYPKAGPSGRSSK
ncbi:MAG: RsmD family RNA methyltransferase [Sedimentisphaerales bacterium]|nr:RsmD family RNA methyltransferase [Sedimentisphaerales bacterium]